MNGFGGTGGEDGGARMMRRRYHTINEQRDSDGLKSSVSNGRFRYDAYMGRGAMGLGQGRRGQGGGGDLDEETPLRITRREAA